MIDMHPQTRAAWASAALFGPAARLRAIAASYTREGLDPDAFVRRYGVAALTLLGVRVNVRRYDAAPAPKRRVPPWSRRDVRRYHGRLGESVDLSALCDAWEREHPNEDAARDAWWDGPEAAEIIGSADRDIIGEEVQRDRLREQHARAERERQAAALREVRERVRGGASAEERASAWLSYRGTGPNDAWKVCVGLVRGFALNESTALAMLEAEYVPRYHRALPRPELLGMVRRAARASKPWGYLLTEERRTG